MALEKNEFVNKDIYILDEKECKLISPFACFVVGCTGSGKSWTVLQWLKNPNLVFREKYNDIYYFYGSTYQDAFRHPCLKHVHFSNDLKKLEKITTQIHKKPGILIILDDLMNIAANSRVIEDLYTRGSHHHHIDVINIIQNFFYKAHNFVTLKENTQYVFVKRFINECKIKLLATQVGVDSGELTTAYLESLNKDRYEGILIDNHIDSNIRKVGKIRDKIDSDRPGLYITPKKFEYYHRKGVLLHMGGDDYLLDFALLKDKRPSYNTS
jgi:hypothetical protein